MITSRTLAHQPAVFFRNIKEPAFFIEALQYDWNVLTSDTLSRTDNYKIILLNEGGCDCNTENTSMHLSAGDISIIPPRQLHSIMPDANADGYVFSFSYDFLKLAVNTPAVTISDMTPGFSDSYTLAITPDEMQQIITVARQMMIEYQSASTLKEEMLRSLFRVFMLFLWRVRTANGNVDHSRSPSLVKRFLNLLEDHYETLKMPADYADLLAVTPAYLNKVIKKSCGFTTSYFIQQRVVAEAKRLVMYSELSLKEISYRLGFEDASHFSKFFKKFTGESYTEFRRHTT